MPVGSSPTATPSQGASVAPVSLATGGSLDVSSFQDRVGAAAAQVPTGSLTLQITTQLPTGPLTLKYDGAYDVRDQSAPRCRLDGAQNGQPLTMIVIGDDLYTRAGLGKYSKSSVSDAVAKLGLATVRPDLPTLVALVSSSLRSLTYIGPDTVDGLAVGHWQATVNSSAFAPTATGTTVVDLWIDSDDLVRQIGYSLTSGGLVSATSTVTVTYSGFNSGVSITPPDASEIR